MPPGFMNATTAPPKSVGDVDASCASAITSPSVDSCAELVARNMSAAMEPTTRFSIGSEIAVYASDQLVSCRHPASRSS